MLIPLTSVGVASVALVDAATIARIGEEGSAALAAGQTARVPKSLSQPQVTPPKDESPDAINPVSNPVEEPSVPEEGPMHPITQEPEGGSSRTGHPTFVGNALWVTPGTLVSLGNTVWQKLSPASYVSTQKEHSDRKC